MIDPRRAILFVGAGISRNLGLPSWNELLTDMARDLDYDPEILALHGDNLALAEYYLLQKKAFGSVRSRMDRMWHKDESLVDSSEIHQKLVDLRFPIIYTTNYDSWLEIAYSRRNVDFVKVTSVASIAQIREDVTQIVKFHGDFDDDNSLVLNETSYFERLAFESPLDIKLRSDSLGKPILFIGYSLSDINIRYLLYKLNKLWERSVHASVRPSSYIFLSRPNPVQEAILRSRGIEPVVSSHDDASVGLLEFLRSLAP